MSIANTDVEAKKSPTEFLEGYTDFAQYIASDEELSIYRRFGSLGARNILYLQAELQVLEAELQRLDDEDKTLGQSNSGGTKKQTDFAARAWESFQQQSPYGLAQMSPGDACKRQTGKCSLWFKILS
ncbi:hypothetical protein MMC18_001509 [Xylographa bjoerkii]|nr:hypothetical protein [Xylographa bjoerkii]